jgi:anaerobic selenocysteine-containing dehydrogenase
MDLIVQRTRQLLDEHGPSSLGFYTTGQLFLEEYYTLTTAVRGGLACNHLDGNTRLCTATSGEALKETFAADGQPGSYADIDHADTMLWMRMLDRLEGPNPPRLLVVDPRQTKVADRATGAAQTGRPGFSDRPLPVNRGIDLSHVTCHPPSTPGPGCPSSLGYEREKHANEARRKRRNPAYCRVLRRGCTRRWPLGVWWQ